MARLAPILLVLALLVARLTAHHAFTPVYDDKRTVTVAGRLNLSEVGWTAETIKAGEPVTVTGNPTHSESSRMFFRKLVRADGSELLPGPAQRDSAIEQERRERAKARQAK